MMIHRVCYFITDVGSTTIMPDGCGNRDMIGTGMGYEGKGCRQEECTAVVEGNIDNT
ncbi:MAG: hypothetical protein LIO79_06090 [Rikenellaceae bacterium]|nr:hypothetical protein [Rikenellaceae bacterium]